MSSVTAYSCILGSVGTFGAGSSAFYWGSWTIATGGWLFGSSLCSDLSTLCRLSLFLFLSFFLLSFGPSCDRIRDSFFLSFFSSSLYSPLYSWPRWDFTSIPFTSLISLTSFFSCMRDLDGQFFLRCSSQSATCFFCSSVCSLVGFF